MHRFSSRIGESAALTRRATGGRRRRTLEYVEEADRAQHRVQTGYMGNRIDREHG